MQAVRLHEFGEIDTLVLEDVPDPVIGPEEVLLRIKGIAVNFVDLLVIGGAYQFLPPRPFSPGKVPVGEKGLGGRN